MPSTAELRKKKAKEMWEENSHTDQEIADKIGVQKRRVHDIKKELGFTNMENSSGNSLIDLLLKFGKPLIPIAVAEMISDEDKLEKIITKIMGWFEAFPELTMAIGVAPFIYKSFIRPFLSDEKNQLLIDNALKIWPMIKIPFIALLIFLVVIVLARKFSGYLGVAFSWFPPFIKAIVDVIMAIVDFLGGVADLPENIGNFFGDFAKGAVDWAGNIL